MKQPYNFRTDVAVLERAKVVFEDYHMSVTTGLNLFLEKVVENPKIVAELFDKESETDKIFEDLRSEIMIGYEEYLAGKYTTLDELEDKWK